MTAPRIDLMVALERVGACQDAREWLAEERRRHPHARHAVERWDACPRGDWLLWLAAKAGVDRKLLVLAACDCARLVLHLVPAGEERPRIAIETAEAWCRGEATIEQVRAAAAAAADADAAAAAAAAYAAHYAAYAAHYAAAADADAAAAAAAAAYAAAAAAYAYAYAAHYAAYAAHYAADAYAAYAAAAAAYAADADAAAAAYAADADAAAARAQMHARCANVVRARIPYATVERGLYLAAGGVL